VSQTTVIRTLDMILYAQFPRRLAFNRLSASSILRRLPLRLPL
jgi:hypothetical protein